MNAATQQEHGAPTPCHDKTPLHTLETLQAIMGNGKRLHEQALECLHHPQNEPEAAREAWRQYHDLHAELLRLPLDSNVQIALDQIEESRDFCREVMDLLSQW